jgi:hypothetical protein
MSGGFIDLHARLRGYPRAANAEHWDGLATEAGALIDAAREQNDADGANCAWHLAMVASVRAAMCRLFVEMQDGEFRSAWCALEQVEKMVEAVKINAILADDFAIDQLGAMVADWQRLYPYTVFASPELIIKRQECTICQAPVSPMRPCGHLPGRVYCGKMCSRRITDCEAVSIALVRDPVQKYSVLIPEVDPHDYARVRFVLDRLRGPFSRWRLFKTAILHDHSHFDSWSRQGNCPCHSGSRYADCCALLPGVRLPHDQICFEEPPPADLPPYLLRRRSQANGELEDVTFGSNAGEKSLGPGTESPSYGTRS